MALVTSVLSAILGNVPVLLGSVEVMNQMDLPHQVSMTDGALWPALSFASSIGGSMLLTGSIAGVLLMRMEGMSFRWYLRHITPKVIAGFLVGYAIVLVMTLCNVF